jgi:dolichol-phosphate mannosyltransferase
LLLDKTVGDVVPARFLIFGMVGALGVVLALAMLFMLVRGFHLSFYPAQMIATFGAMTANFFLNNNTTYRDRRLQGRKIWWGLTSFYAACSLGFAINIRIADGLERLGIGWFVAGGCGLLIGAIWNYGVTSFFTWRRSRYVRHKSVAGPALVDRQVTPPPELRL